MLPNAHRLIALLNTIAKILSACVVEDLVQMVELHGLLPDNHFGCRLGRTTMDLLHYLTKYIKDMWRKNEVVSALFLDIKSAFPSIMLEHLLCDMRRRGVPPTYIDWIRCKTGGCTTSLVFNGFVSKPVVLHRGIDQGCPLSGILFQFYNADLIDIYNPKKDETAVMFMDDALILACAKTLTEASTKLVDIMM